MQALDSQGCCIANCPKSIHPHLCKRAKGWFLRHAHLGMHTLEILHVFIWCFGSWCSSFWSAAIRTPPPAQPSSRSIQAWLIATIPPIPTSVTFTATSAQSEHLLSSQISQVLSSSWLTLTSSPSPKCCPWSLVSQLTTRLQISASPYLIKFSVPTRQSNG